MTDSRGKWSSLVVSLIIAAAAAAIGSVASVSAASFYASLRLPSWAPPAGLFGPVWTVLYLMMAIASWMIWRSDAPNRRGVLVLYLVQLALNALWSWIFFAWHNGAGAMLEIVILWFAILATIIAFMRIRRAAGILLVPYLMWVTFASALTFYLWRSSPELLG